MTNRVRVICEPMKLEVLTFPIYNDRALLYMGTSVIGWFFGVVLLVIAGSGLIPLSFAAFAIASSGVYSLAVIIKYMFEETAHQKKLNQFEAIKRNRLVNIHEVKWLDEHNSDCILYILNTFIPHGGGAAEFINSKEYVKFLNKTDEMLFTIAMGQSRGN